ncbi:MAG: hypothetical protein ACC654_01175 [Acidimicrobiia bacterium]
MSSRSLEDDLLDIPGVEGAELDGAGASPAGLRIRIAEGADQRVVGSEIRRVLNKHGLGTGTRLPGEGASADEPAADDSQSDDSQVAAPVQAHDTESRDPGEQPEPATSQEESGTSESVETPSPVAVLTEPPTRETGEVSDEMIDLTDVPHRDGEDDDGVDVPEGSDTSEPASTGVEASPDLGSWTESQESIVEPAMSAKVRSPSMKRAANSSSQQDQFAVVPRIDRVAVEEGRDGIVVTVSSTDGRSESQPASSTEGGVEKAVVKAASSLAQPGFPDPTIVEIEDRRIEGVDIVMIVLDIDGTVSAGSAIVAAGRSFALGRATWAALSL